MMLLDVRSEVLGLLSCQGSAVTSSFHSLFAMLIAPSFLACVLIMRALASWLAAQPACVGADGYAAGSKSGSAGGYATDVSAAESGSAAPKQKQLPLRSNPRTWLCAGLQNLGAESFSGPRKTYELVFPLKCLPCMPCFCHRNHTPRSDLVNFVASELIFRPQTLEPRLCVKRCALDLLRILYIPLVMFSIENIGCIPAAGSWVLRGDPSTNCDDTGYKLTLYVSCLLIGVLMFAVPIALLLSLYSRLEARQPSSVHPAISKFPCIA